jgi:hypothetical protein
MIDFTKEVDSARAGTTDVPRTQYQRWIRVGDLSTRARVYAFTRDAWSRIRPEPDMSEQCTFMAEYLIECLVSNPQGDDDFVHSGFEAGYERAAWLKHLAKNTENRIETGALEWGQDHSD